MKRKLKSKIKRTIVKLLRLNNSPPEIALGVSIGVFIAILPVYGLHTVLVIIAAILVRPANKIAILAGTNISLPPTLPFITWAGYEIGRVLLKNGYPSLSWSDFKNVNFQKILNIYPTLFIGSVILGLLCAFLFYFLTLYFVIKFKEKRALAKDKMKQKKTGGLN